MNYLAQDISQSDLDLLLDQAWVRYRSKVSLYLGHIRNPFKECIMYSPLDIFLNKSRQDKQEPNTQRAGSCIVALHTNRSLTFQVLRGSVLLADFKLSRTDTV